MRTAWLIALAVLGLACARRLRSADPDAWLEVQSEHFDLRTDIGEVDARKAIADLELLRNALLTAGWHRQTGFPGRTGVVLLASEREVHEFLRKTAEGITVSGYFGGRMILVNGGGDLLGSELVKHELTHALTFQLLTTNPRWVQEGIACFLETLDIDRSTGMAVRGASPWERRVWLRESKPQWIDWPLLMGANATNGEMDGYAFQTLSWGLVHWLVDTQPEAFNDFLNRLVRGEGMWQAFNASFPSLTDLKIAQAMDGYLKRQPLVKTSFRVPGWDGPVAVRRLPRGEVHALRAELFYVMGADAPRNTRRDFDEELALAKAADPGNPLALALSENASPKLAVERHPDDWRAWVLSFDDNEKDVEAIRKAAALAPDNAGVLARLASAEQRQGHTSEALEHALRARSVAAVPYVLHTLALIYQTAGRCAEATAELEHAVDALPDRVDPRLPAFYREQLADVTAHCGKGDAIGTAVRTVEAVPVLKVCRQPLVVDRTRGISAQFTIREDGTVTAVAIDGVTSRTQNGVIRQFIESCSFEPVVVEGKPRAVQLELKLDDLVH